MRDYANAFRRRARVFFGVFSVAFGIAAAFAFVPPDEYRAAAEMRIDMEGPNVELLEPIMITNYADQYIKSLQQKVMTSGNLRKWLEESDAYWYEGDDVSQAELISRLREDIKVLMVFTSVINEERGQEVNLITGFTTSFAARDPQAAEIVANRVADAFLAEDRATRIDRAAGTSEFLRDQINAKREEIADIESKIATFKEENPNSLPDLMVLNMTQLERTERELESVQREVRTAQQDRFFREAQLEEIRQRLGGSASRLAALEAEYHRAISLYGPDHPDVIRIKRQVAALTGTAGSDSPPAIVQAEAELAAARERYSDEHPDVIALKRRLQELQSGAVPFNGDGSLDDPVYLQLRAQINAIDNNLDGLRERAEQLRTDQASLQDRIARMPQVEREYQVLQRELQTATLAFNDLRNRLTQAQQTESFESGERGARLQQVRSATAPESPTGPPRIAITILGLFIAGTLAGGAAFFAEFTDSSVRGSRDIETVMHTHAIATVPIVQNSVTRAYNRRQIMIVSVSALMLGLIIVLTVATITG